jgi:peptidoglycan hydrolase-like protein with peptidoglycan-binding domain
LQKALNKLVNAGLTVDGDFGTKTEKALKTWQSANSLTVDGIYGSKSQSKMKKALS